MNLEATTQLIKGSKCELNVNVISWVYAVARRLFPPLPSSLLLVYYFFLRNFPQDQNEKNTEVVFEVANIKPLDWASVCVCQLSKGERYQSYSKLTAQRRRNPAGIKNISCLALTLTGNPPILHASSQQHRGEGGGGGKTTKSHWLCYL